MIFKCKNCGGNVIYSPEKKGMFCPYCESEASEECRTHGETEIKFCPDCGGELPVMEHTSALQCPYCDNFLILDGRVQGEYRPKTIIPFKMGKEACKGLVRDKFKKCLFAPTDFLSEVRLNSMQGIYVPFWFYNYETKYDYQGEGTKVKTWVAGDLHYTETSYYNVVRQMDIPFEKIPVDASVDMPDEVMDLMEPYRYEELEEFKPEYMSGFSSEKYNMEASVVESRARQKMTEDAKQMMREQCAGYATLHANRDDFRVTNQSADYGLLPIWKYIYHYKEKDYPFYVNGQTGKIIGEAPISKGKVWAYAGTLWVCLTLILCLINGIITM